MQSYDFAYFSCSAAEVAIEVHSPDGLVKRKIIGNVETLDARDMTGKSSEQVQALMEEIGLGHQSLEKSATVSCTPGTTASVKVYKDSVYMSHGNVEVCYGEMIKDSGVIEIIWSDKLN